MVEINLPEVTDEDIAWAVKVLKLPNDAFSPKKDGGARERILNRTYALTAHPKI